MATLQMQPHQQLPRPVQMRRPSRSTYGSPNTAMSWARDSSLSAMLERGFNNDSSIFDHPTPTSFSHLALLSTSASSYTSDFGDRLPHLEQNFCQGYTCCGLDLNDLHGLLEHFEECHVLGTSPAGSSMVSPPSVTDQNRSSATKNITSPRALQLAEMKRRAAAGLAAASSNKASSIAMQQRSTSSSTDPGATPEASTSALPATGPFSMDDDLDMEMPQVEVVPTADPLVNSNILANSTNLASSRHFSSALRHGLDALTLSGSNLGAVPIGTANRRSASPGSVSSPDISAPTTPQMESDLDDWDPSSSSSSIARMFPPTGTVTPSMLFPANKPTVAPSNLHKSAGRAFMFGEVDAEDSETDDDLDNDEIRHRGRAEEHAPDFSQGDFKIVMGTDPTLTHLNAARGSAFVAPPPTLPSGRAWVAPADKPFKCPVPGCDKAYKQQNGLKYHRLHGNCNNRARLDGLSGDDTDGRETLEEKPYGCYVGAGCGKRYKNMNGLRYHYQHSGPHGQIGLEMLAMGTHPPPLNGGRAISRTGSAASSRASSRASSPAPAAHRADFFA